MLFYILLTFCGTSLACPDVKPAENSDLAQYARGKWYEIARYNSYDIEQDADCVTYTFEPTTSRTHKATIQEFKDNNVKTFINQMYETEETGKVIFHSDISSTPNVTAYVLATDNESYYIFYNCFINNKNQAQEYAWIVSKTPTITPELKSVIHKYVDEIHVLDSSKFIWDHLTHDDCKTDKK